MDGERPKESVFWIETEKIKPNPMQPRHDFDGVALQSLADSIREYGILQPLVVCRVEKEVPTGRAVEYELIAGERRLRAAILLGLREIPVIIRKEETAKVKLELALVENVQREDLNPIERALAFKRLVDDFGLLQREVAQRVGKSREVIANSLRLLNLPETLKANIARGAISEGHARPLLMLTDHPQDQEELFQEIVAKNLSVREAERISRRIAAERAKSRTTASDPETRAMEDKLGNFLGTRVFITKDRGGKGRISIEFFSEEELHGITRKLENFSEKPGSEELTFTV